MMSATDRRVSTGPTPATVSTPARSGGLTDQPEGTLTPRHGGGSYLLFLGRISPANGVLQAIIAAHAAGMDLLIATKCSEPEEVSYFGREVQPMLGPSCQFLGDVTAVERARLLAGAAALINPIQRADAATAVMIESLAVGTPVITTRMGPAPEIIDDGMTGFLCGSLRDLVSACRRTASLDRTACQRSAEDRRSGEVAAEFHEGPVGQLARPLTHFVGTTGGPFASRASQQVALSV